jgi:hypothetical protein
MSAAALSAAREAEATAIRHRDPGVLESSAFQLEGTLRVTGPCVSNCSPAARHIAHRRTQGLLAANTSAWIGGRKPAKVSFITAGAGRLAQGRFPLPISSAPEVIASSPWYHLESSIISADFIPSGPVGCTARIALCASQVRAGHGGTAEENAPRGTVSSGWAGKIFTPGS